VSDEYRLEGRKGLRSIAAPVFMARITAASSYSGAVSVACVTGMTVINTSVAPNLLSDACEAVVTDRSTI